MYPSPLNHSGPPPFGSFPQQQASPTYPQQQPQFTQGHYQQPANGQFQFQANFQQGGTPQFAASPTGSQHPHKRQKGNPVITRYPPPIGYQAPPQGQPSFGQTQGSNGTYPHQGWQPTHQSPQTYQQPGATSFAPGTGGAFPQNAPSVQTGQFGILHSSPTQYQQPGSWQPGHHQPQSQFQQATSYGSGSNAPPYQQPQQFQAQQYNSQPYQPQHNFQTPPGQQPQQAFQSRVIHNGFGKPHRQSSQPNYQHAPQQHWAPTQQSQTPGGPPHVSPNKHQQYGFKPKRQSSFPQPSRNGLSQDAPHSLPPKPGLKRSASAMSAEAEDDLDLFGKKVVVVDPLNMRVEEWEYDDSDVALWPKTNEPVDSALSIGILIWHPAHAMTRALAHTFEEAEEASKKPTPASFGNDESVSKYCTVENSHDAFLDIRSLPYWDNIKDDPVFVQFPEKYETIPVHDAVKVRDRPDVQDEDSKEDGEIGMSDRTAMEGIEQNHTDVKSPHSTEHEQSRESVNAHAVPAVRNDEQEDILAKLGVTGEAKPVYATPGPAYGPSDKVDSDDSPRSFHRSNEHTPPVDRTSSATKQDRDQGYADHRSPRAEREARLGGPPDKEQRFSHEDRRPNYDYRRYSYEDRKPGYDERRSSNGYRAHTYDDRRSGHVERWSKHIPPPPQEPPRSRSPEFWSTNRSTDGRHSPARSDRSNRTVTGSDFGGVDLSTESTNGNHRSDLGEERDQTASNRNNSSNTRKRSLAEDDNDDNEKHRQTDDSVTPKAKRRQSGVSSAYSRR